MSKQMQKIEAEKKINVLFEKAEKCAEKNPSLARDYIRKARRKAMHHNIKLPRGLRKKFCCKCYVFFTPQNCKLRLKHGFLVLHCLNCGTLARHKVY